MLCKNKKCSAELIDGAVYCHVCGTRQVAPERNPRKRGNGQGTAIKRGNTWTALWTVSCEIVNGKMRQERKSKGGFATKRDALAFAAAPVEDAPKLPTLNYYWLAWSRSDYLDLSPSKQTAYDIAWTKLGSLKNKEIGNLTISNLQNIVDEKASTYYPARDMKTLLSHLYKRAVAEGTARTNLATFIRLPPLNETEQEAFNETEIKKLWEAYGKGDYFIGYILTMIYSGMMPGELLALKSSMVDIEKCEIKGVGLKTKERKEKPIVFPLMISPVLSDLIERGSSRTGKVVNMNKDNFYKEYHSTLQRIGVRDLPPYSCRHTTATALALGNVAPSVIQRIMRHTKFATTQRYIHPDNTSAHEAINTIIVESD